MNNFGTRSRACVDSTHPDMQLIHNVGIERCPVDYGVHEGRRTFEKQLEYFLGGKSRLDPRNSEQIKKAKHMKDPSMATDHHVAEKYGEQSLAWNQVHLAFVAGYLISLSHELYRQGRISHVLRWGGDWDGDGIIALDQKFDDLPHLELVKPEW